jgi:hypothetical protein
MCPGQMNAHLHKSVGKLECKLIADAWSYTARIQSEQFIRISEKIAAKAERIVQEEWERNNNHHLNPVRRVSNVFKIFRLSRRCQPKTLNF